MNSVNPTEKPKYFLSPEYHLARSERMILAYMVLCVLGPLVLVGGIYLIRLRQPHAVHVSLLGLGLTVLGIVSLVSEFLGF